MQCKKLVGGGNTLGGKIPRQIEAVGSGTTGPVITTEGTEWGVQSLVLMFIMKMLIILNRNDLKRNSLYWFSFKNYKFKF